MTIIFTLRDRKNIVMASDRRSCEKDLTIIPMNEPKIFEGDGFFIGAAGTGDMCAYAIKAFRDRFKVSADEDLEKSIQKFVDSLTAPFWNDRAVEVGILITFLDSDDTFSITINGSAVMVEKVTDNYYIGCGAGAARHAHQTLQKIKHKTSLKKLARQILDYVASSNAGCGDGGDILIVDRGKNL